MIPRFGQNNKKNALTKSKFVVVFLFTKGERWYSSSSSSSSSSTNKNIITRLHNWDALFSTPEEREREREDTVETKRKTETVNIELHGKQLFSVLPYNIVHFFSFFLPTITTTTTTTATALPFYCIAPCVLFGSVFFSQWQIEYKSLHI